MSFAIVHLIPRRYREPARRPHHDALTPKRPRTSPRPSSRSALPVQYGLWLIGALHDDFSNSLVIGLPVGPQIASHPR